MILAAENLAFGYPGHKVGEGVSLAIQAGEVLALIGPNGSGKTTFFKTLLGLIPAEGGAVRLDGAALADTPREAVARRIAYVPQAHEAFFPFSVREVVLMGRAARVKLFAQPGAADIAAADEALARLSISHLAERSYTAISGGERQMALIARALAQQPQVLVMDEPTANLDFGNQARVLETVTGLAAEGLAIVLSTHDPDQALACAGSVALLKNGRLIAHGPPLETLTPAALKGLYGVDVTVTYVEALGRHVCAAVLPEAVT